MNQLVKYICDGDGSVTDLPARRMPGPDSWLGHLPVLLVESKLYLKFLGFHRKAVRVRKQRSCVRNGIYKVYFHASDKFYMYSMTDEIQKILVVCAFGEKDVKFPSPQRLRHGPCSADPVQLCAARQESAEALRV